LLNFSRGLGRALGATGFAALVNQGLPASVRNDNSIDHRLVGQAREHLVSALHLPFLTAMGLCVAILLVLAYALEERPLRTTVEERAAEPAEVAG
jgi:hypothetical protein